MLIVGLTPGACSDGASQVAGPDTTTTDNFSAGTAVRWNQRAVALVVARQPASNGQAAVSRILTYLSVAQYRAVIAAQAAANSVKPPSIGAAIGGASVAVLNSFFPLDVAATEAQLNGDLAVPPWPSEHTADLVAGESLGRSIGAAVVSQAAADNYLTVAPPATPVGPDKWVSAPSAAVVRSLYGARPFFLTAANQLRAAAPPAVGSAAFTTALAEVRRIADSRTPAQVAIANFWNTSSGTFTAGALNLIADSVIRAHRTSDADAARILAFANAATFDAQIACWDSKFTYWFIRPSQMDPGIVMSIALPNHPSYPSGHSCMSAAFFGIVADAFPQDRERLDAMVEEAGMSRVYGGIHYRFDIDAGREIGRAAAAAALRGSLK